MILLTFLLALLADRSMAEPRSDQTIAHHHVRGDHHQIDHPGRSAARFLDEVICSDFEFSQVDCDGVLGCLWDTNAGDGGSCVPVSCSNGAGSADQCEVVQGGCRWEDGGCSTCDLGCACFTTGNTCNRTGAGAGDSAPCAWREGTCEPTQEEPNTNSTQAPSISSNPSASVQPSSVPSSVPSSGPSSSDAPSKPPPAASGQPSSVPSLQPSVSDVPSGQVSEIPSSQPSLDDSSQPSSIPSMQPSASDAPSSDPSSAPSTTPSTSFKPSVRNSTMPSASFRPSEAKPTLDPVTLSPTVKPDVTASPVTPGPTKSPITAHSPTGSPTCGKPAVIANDDATTTPKNTPQIIDVLGNDLKAFPNTTLHVESLHFTGRHGTCVISNDKKWVKYIPSLDFFGTDTCIYEVCDDNNLSCDVATIEITVQPSDDDVVAQDDRAFTQKGGDVEVFVLQNDTAVAHYPLAITRIVTNGNNGECVVFNDTVVMYVPSPDFVGEDSCVYEACDDRPKCDTATVYIFVNGTKEDPCPEEPTTAPFAKPSLVPSSKPSTSSEPTLHPTPHPTHHPTPHPTQHPTLHPTPHPTMHPTPHPTPVLTQHPTLHPTPTPSVPAIIGPGTIWNDVNQNGIQDNGELGLAGIIIALYCGPNGSSATKIGTTTTDANGQYIFTNVQPNDCFIQVENPDWAYSPRVVGGNTLDDSGRSLVVDVKYGDNITFLDGGLYKAFEETCMSHCDKEIKDCGWGIWNVCTCQCDCNPGVCLSANQKCYDGCMTHEHFNTWGGCRPGVDCPWYPSPSGETHCESSANFAGIHSTYESAEICCQEHFSMNGNCAQSSIDDVQAEKALVLEKLDRTRYFWPDQFGKKNCVFDSGYDTWMKDDGKKEYYLFENEEACCGKWFPAKTNCPDTTATTPLQVDYKPDPSEQWYYPNMSKSNCRFGRNYPMWMSMSPKHYLYTTPEQCCSEWYPARTDCPQAEDDGVQEGFYWIVDEAFYPNFRGNNCAYGNSYPEWMADETNRENHIFASVEECCGCWFPARVTECVEGLVTVMNGKQVGGPDVRGTWYPSTGGGFPECINGTPPGWMTAEGYKHQYVFDSHSECCKAHRCEAQREMFD